MTANFDPIDVVLYSVDPVIFTLIDNELHVLAVQRQAEPFKGMWALPGGRVDKSCKNLDEALMLKLKEKTGIENIYFEQMQTYGAKDMDPRGWSVTTAYLALVNKNEIDYKNIGTKTTAPVWIKLKDIIEGHIPMAFWHTRIIFDSLDRLKSKSRYTDLPVNLMEEEFTFSTLRAAYEAILGIEITRQSFVKRMEDSNIFEDTGKKETGVSKPATLYRKIARGGSHYFPREIGGP